MFSLTTIKQQPMVKPRSNRKPTFFWQAMLIVLPVAVLAVVGLFSLRQDKVLAEQEAREQAQAIAWPLAHECGTRLGTEINQFAEISLKQQETIALIAGTLMPGPGQDAGEQIRAEMAWVRQDAPATRSALEAIAGTRQRSDDPLRANAELRLLLIESGIPDFSESFHSLLKLARIFPRVQTEAGLPLSAIACHHAIRLAPSGDGFDKFLDDFVFQMQNAPSILTGRLLDEVESRAKTEDNHAQERARAIKAVWTAQERARSLLRHVSRDESVRQGALFLSSESGRFLAFCHPSYSVTTNFMPTATNVSTGVTSSILLVPFALIDQAFQRAMRAGQLRPPDYAAVHLGFGAQQFDYFHPSLMKAGATNQSALTLATVVDGVSFFAGGYLPFTLKLELADPELLFARHRQRVRLFGATIILAAATALVGLLASWRSFHRQLRLSEMKSNFVSSVSHELRAPIASVRLMAESLDRGKIPDAQKQAEYFRLIVQECRRLTALIENVLDFSRIDQGRKQYEFEPTDLVSLIEQTVKLMEPCAVERQVTLSAAIERNPCSTLDPQPEMDGRAVQQALVNLLDNAIKHSPAGKSVTVGIEQRRAGVSPDRLSRDGPSNEPTPDPSQEGNAVPGRANDIPSREGSGGGLASVQLWVEDCGDGIPPEEHGKIFEPFYRRGTELRRETQGIGIGLTIVRHIVEAHGGRVLVRSAVGQGSRFTIELPLNQTPKRA